MEISVIIPVYNKEAYLEQCFESIFSQDFDAFEVVAVDDGSTDQSGTICDRWAEKEARLSVVHTPNGGVTAARRLGVERATGRFIMFADADDGLEKHALKLMYEAICKSGADEVFAPFKFVNGILSPIVYQGVVEPEPLIKAIITNKNRFPVLWSIIFRRELLEGVLDTPRDIIEGEDKLMQVKVLMKEPRIFFITDYAYIYNLGVPNSRRRRLETEQLYDRLLQETLAPKEAVFRSAFTLHQLKEYERFILDGHFEVRRKYYKEAVKDLSGIPLYDKLVFILPPVLARPVIRLYRLIIDIKQKGT